MQRVHHNQLSLFTTHVVIHGSRIESRVFFTLFGTFLEEHNNFLNHDLTVLLALL